MSSSEPAVERVETSPTINPAAVLLPGFDGTELPEWVAARLRAGLAGVCLFGTNIESRAQLRALTESILAANPNALIAIDEEGGDVTRLYYDQGSPYPGNALLGRIDDLALTEHVARVVGWELRLAGVNLNFAPDVDINSNPDNPVIGTRSFGSDPELVSRHSAAWVRGLQSTGVAASCKHFPGHGDTATDSHLALPVVDRAPGQLLERELRPFRASIEAGTRTIMTSHILLPQLDAERPATLSPRILQGLLRDELGFDGVIVSDALDMKGASGAIGIPEAAVLAIGAGCDLLCIGTSNTDAQLADIERAISAAVADGRLSEERLADAGRRNQELATTLLADAAAAGIPVYITSGEEPRFELDRAIAAFDARTSVVLEPDHLVVALETLANMAVGIAPWGLGAAGSSVVQLHEGDPVPLGRQLVIVGKDNHRRAWVRELVDEARQRHPQPIVIDMGWPGDDRRYADIATFGASRYAGQALATWLDRQLVEQKARA